MQIIDGRKIAESVITRLKKRSAPGKFLATVLVGDDPASASFVKQKGRVAKELGVDFLVVRIPADVAEIALRDKIKKLSDDDARGGIVLQLPLPAHLNRDKIIAAIPLEKDVDALRGGNLVLPPAVGVVEEIIENLKLKIENYRVAVVGRGFLVGQPIAKWLKRSANSHELAEVVTLDIGDDLARLKDADIAILGVGEANLVKPEMLKPGALVIDFGYSRDENGKLRGDFDSSQIGNWKLEIGNLRYTPVPHGTGPILVAKLFENFYELSRTT